MAARNIFPGIESVEVSPLDSPDGRDAVRDAVRETAAKFYASGVKRSKIARIMVDHLVPNGKDRPLEQRLSQARNKLKRWEKDDKFRDLIWDTGLTRLDLEAPKIMQGLAKKAKKGHVDAARLGFELTGRHNPKGEQQPPSVVIAIGNGVPRPIMKPDNANVVIDPEDPQLVLEEGDED